MARAPSKLMQPVSARRKPPLADSQKKEKGRSRNACDRCKQKKVKCDGEGQRVCSICKAGDYQCTYAQRPHEDKRQYRKGYVEMVEETNNYYKTGLHECYRIFQKANIFNDLQVKYASGGEPTVQEIISALGVAATGTPHEGGIECIESYLEKQDRPIMERNGEWDREVSARQVPSPEPSSDDDMEDENSISLASNPSPRSFEYREQAPQIPIPQQHNSPVTSSIAQMQRANSLNPSQAQFKTAAQPLLGSRPLNITTTRNSLTQSYLAQLNGRNGTASSGGSPVTHPGTPESIALSHYSFPSPHSPFSPSQEDLDIAVTPASINTGFLPASMAFNTPLMSDGTVSLADVELNGPDVFDWMSYPVVTGQGAYVRS